MPDPSIITFSANHMGFYLTVKTPSVMGILDNCIAILNIYESLQLCRYHEKITGSNTEKHFIVSTPNRHIGKAISNAMQMLDNTEKFN